MGMQRIDAERRERLESSPLCVVWDLKRRGLIPLANSENGTVQGAVATWWTRKSAPTRRQVAIAPCTVPIRQRYQDSRRSICSALLNTQPETDVIKN